MSELSPRVRLYHWVKMMYRGKVVRSTNIPYMNHLTFVAAFSEDAFPLAYEMGLCHDLFEDTALNRQDLMQKLTDFGYASKDAVPIAAVVQELNTIYTKDNYPELSKKERHRLEDQRLIACSGHAQSIKYGDIIYNARWTAANDPKKLKDYLYRKLHLLEQLNKGDLQLQEIAIRNLKKYWS